MEKYEIVIIGGGPAGLAAAVSARNAGIKLPEKEAPIFTNFVR